jgi:hypothetical protein
VKPPKTDPTTQPVKPPKDEQGPAGQVTTPQRTGIRPLYWIRNDKQIMKDGKQLLTDTGEISHARLSWDGKYVAYTRNATELVLVNLATGKRTTLAGVRGETTVNYGDGGKEHEWIIPAGFSADNARLYFIKQQSSVFVGGNELHSIALTGGASTLVDKGVADAATCWNGDMLVCKPGAVVVKEKGGKVWEYKPTVRSIYVNGVGFTGEGKPFYYTSDSIHLFSANGEDELRMDSNTGSRPVVLGKTIVWDKGGKIMSNETGKEQAIYLDGENVMPFN